MKDYPMSISVGPITCVVSRNATSLEGEEYDKLSPAQWAELIAQVMAIIAQLLAQFFPTPVPPPTLPIGPVKK